MEDPIPTDDIPKHTLDALTFRSAKRAHDLFVSEYNKPVGEFPEGRAVKLACKTKDEYENISAEVAAAPKGPAPAIKLLMGPMPTVHKSKLSTDLALLTPSGKSTSDSKAPLVVSS
jgi:hypothetical protein